MKEEEFMKRKSSDSSDSSVKNSSLCRYIAFFSILLALVVMALPFSFYERVSPDGVQELIRECAYFELQTLFWYCHYPSLVAVLASVVWFVPLCLWAWFRKSPKKSLFFWGTLSTAAAIVGTFFWDDPLSPWGVLICVLFVTALAAQLIYFWKQRAKNRGGKT